MSGERFLSLGTVTSTRWGRLRPFGPGIRTADEGGAMTAQPKPKAPNSQAPHQEKPQSSPPRRPGTPDTTTRQVSDGDHEPGDGERGLRIGGIRLPLPALSLPAMPATVPKRALWWGGLAALAVVGVVEWPVAAVVGAGSYVAERLSREDSRAS
jgi:hypothetical protein